jgi:hypothetical protein
MSQGTPPVQLLYATNEQKRECVNTITLGMSVYLFLVNKSLKI